MLQALARNFAAGKTLGKLAWNSRVGKGAISGAALGGINGMFNRDQSFLGGVTQGALTGAMIGSGKLGGMGTLGMAVGGAIGGLTSGHILAGGLAGGGLGRYGMRGFQLGQKGFGVGGIATGIGRMMRRDAKAGLKLARQGASSAANIGRSWIKSNKPV